MEDALESSVKAVSSHNPDVPSSAPLEEDEAAEMVNAFGPDIRERYAYVSDSNGYWRFRPLAEVLDGGEDRLHVLTHPEWWQEDEMSPRERIQRCIDGRAAFAADAYDGLLRTAGRRNT